MSQDYCADQVMRHDYEHYVMTLFAPRKQRGALWAIYAFNLELKKVKTLVREPMMGLVRFQWWRDAITQLYAGNTLRHQVLEGISAELKNIHWQENDFQDLINAYENDFETTEIHSIDEGWNLINAIAAPFTRLIETIEKNPASDQSVIINAGYIFLQSILEDSRFKNIDRLLLVSQLEKKLNLVNTKTICKTQAILMYYIMRRNLSSMVKNKQNNPLLLSFYLWYKRLFFNRLQ